MELQLNSAILSNLNNHIIDYPTPASLSYFWGVGALTGICLGILITGVFLSMHYTPHVVYVFWSIEHFIFRAIKVRLICYLYNIFIYLFFTQGSLKFILWF